MFLAENSTLDNAVGTHCFLKLTFIFHFTVEVPGTDFLSGIRAK
jgi:hypothetical protein